MRKLLQIELFGYSYNLTNSQHRLENDVNYVTCFFTVDKERCL